MTATESWQSLCCTLNRWFYRPDIDAYKVTLAVARTRAYDCDPVWLFVIGPSGTGKTAIHCESILGLDRSFVVGSLTPKTFISGKSGAKSLLTHRVGQGARDALLVFKDFTTILSLRDDDQREIMGQFREIHDGLLRRDTGDVSLEWRGRITVIAATTPGIDHMWSVNRTMGDRFISVRINHRDTEGFAEMACSQNGHEQEIRNELRDSVKLLLERSCLFERGPEYIGTVKHLAFLTAALKTHVFRDKSDHGKITEVGAQESCARITKSLSSVYQALDELFGLAPEHYDIICRLALDSAPPIRRLLIASLPVDLPATVQELCQVTSLPRTTLLRHSEELVAIGFWQEQGGSKDLYAFTDYGKELIRNALPNHP